MTSQSYSESYAAAGVDITAGYRAVELMKRHVERTRTPGVMSGLGGFGGLFAPELAGMERPIPSLAQTEWDEACSPSRSTAMTRWASTV